MSLGSKAGPVNAPHAVRGIAGREFPRASPAERGIVEVRPHDACAAASSSAESGAWPQRTICA